MENLAYNLILTTNTAEKVNEIVKDVGAIKTAIITTEKTQKHSFFDQIKKQVFNRSIITVSDAVKNNDYFYELLHSKCAENVSLLVVVGAEPIVDLVKLYSTRQGLPLLVVPTAIGSFGFASNKVVYYQDYFVKYLPCKVPLAVVVDGQLVNSASQQQVACLLGELAAGLSAIMDGVYFKLTNNSVNLQTLKQLENLVSATAFLPANVLLTSSGKSELVMAVHKKNLLVNSLGSANFSAENVVLALSYLTGFRVERGLISMQSALALQALYFGVFKQKNLSYNFLPNLEIRLRRVGNLFSFQNNKWVDSANQGVNLRRVQPVWEVYEKLSGRYLKCCQQVNKTFKNLFNDKAVFLQKAVPTTKVLQAVCFAQDLFDGVNLLGAIRNSGFLDFTV